MLKKRNCLHDRPRHDSEFKIQFLGPLKSTLHNAWCGFVLQFKNETKKLKQCYRFIL